MRVFSVILLFAVGAVFGQSGAADKPAREQMPEYHRARVLKDAEFASYLADLTISLEKTKDVLVFEGLPHPLTERELFEQERAQKKVTVLHDADFYAGPRRPTAEQLVRLIEFLPESLSEYRGAKLCGGFHADYAVRWHDAGQHRWTALFCYGCGEAAIFGPNGSLKADLGGPFRATWRDLLREFDAQRVRAAR